MEWNFKDNFFKTTLGLLAANSMKLAKKFTFLSSVHMAIIRSVSLTLQLATDQRKEEYVRSLA